MKSHYYSILEDLGLTMAESKVYLALLDLGSSQAVNITSKTQLHRRTVYDAIERLIEKGLIRYIRENNIKKYEAVEPSNLRKMVLEKEKNLDSILPDLSGIYSSNKKKEQTTFYRGKKGLKSVFNHQLEIGSEICIMGASKKANDILKYYFPHFDNERVDKKIPVRIIFDESARDDPAIKKIPMAKIKFVPSEFSSPSATNVYGDCVAIVLWTESDPVAIMIQNEAIAKGYKNQFELLWKIAKK